MHVFLFNIFTKKMLFELARVTHVIRVSLTKHVGDLLCFLLDSSIICKLIKVFHLLYIQYII